VSISTRVTLDRWPFLMRAVRSSSHRYASAALPPVTSHHLTSSCLLAESRGQMSYVHCQPRILLPM